MRLIVFIMITYILGLSFVPCGDANNRSEVSAMETRLNEPHNHCDDTKDSCSIFCYCNCCSGNVTVFEYQLPKIEGIQISIYFDNRMPMLDTPILSNYFETIWQPPKVNA